MGSQRVRRDFTSFDFGGLRSHMSPCQKKNKQIYLKKKKNQGLPGSSRVKTPYSQCRGWGSSPVRELRSHMTCMAQPDQKKKKKRNKRPSTPQKFKNKIIKTNLGGFAGGWVVKNLPANAGDTGSIPRLGRSPGEGNESPLQCSCLENPRDRGARQATVQRVKNSQTQLSD